jgi:hypothetical protein
MCGCVQLHRRERPFLAKGPISGRTRPVGQIPGRNAVNHDFGWRLAASD